MRRRRGRRSDIAVLAPVTFIIGGFLDLWLDSLCPEATPRQTGISKVAITKKGRKGTRTVVYPYGYVHRAHEEACLRFAWSRALSSSSPSPQSVISRTSRRSKRSVGSFGWSPGTVWICSSVRGWRRVPGIHLLRKIPRVLLFLLRLFDIGLWRYAPHRFDVRRIPC